MRDEAKIAFLLHPSSFILVLYILNNSTFAA